MIMFQLLQDRRLFVSTIGIIASAAFPAVAPFVAAIVGVYLANRAITDPKKEGVE